MPKQTTWAALQRSYTFYFSLLRNRQIKHENYVKMLLLQGIWVVIWSFQSPSNANR